MTGLQLFRTLGASVIALGLMGGSVLAADYQWTFQTSETAGEPTYKLKQAWAKNVETMTNGRIKISILPTEAVVPHNQTLDAVSSGILQGHLTDPSYFSGRNPAFSMLGNLVGAWSDPLQFLEYMKYGGGDQLYNKLVEPYGVHLIGSSATGLEALVSKKPIRTVADLKGIKIRAPEGMVYDIFKLAGAAPVNLPGSEVYTSLEKGVIDAADYTVFVTNQSQGLNQIAHYPNYPGFHSLPMVAVSINKKIWDGLPPDLKSILEASVDKLAFDTVFTLKKLDLKAVQEAKKDPKIHIIDMAPAERAKFRRIAQQEWKVWAKKNALCGEIYDSVVKFLTQRNLI